MLQLFGTVVINSYSRNLVSTTYNTPFVFPETNIDKHSLNYQDQAGTVLRPHIDFWYPYRGVHEDHKSKVLYSIKTLLQGFKGLSVVPTKT